jgi:predicted TIM-barrel fold metal-dependent hydrolase
MVIDALTHILPLYFNENRDEALTRDRTFAALFANPKARIVQAEHLLEEMDRAGIERSVIAGFGWTDQELARRSNDYLLESTEKYPEALIPLCSVNPLWPDDAASKEAERCLKFGARGIGELHADTQGWVEPPYDRLADVMSVAREHGDDRNRIVFVVIHGSEPLGHSYPGKGTMTPDRLVRLAEQYPDNAFIFSHLGGGLPFFQHMPKVKQALANVWYDSAATPFLYEPEIYTTVESLVGGTRIFFASDFPIMSQRRALAHLRGSELNPYKQKMILEVAGQLYDFSRSNQSS